MRALSLKKKKKKKNHKRLKKKVGKNTKQSNVYELWNNIGMSNINTIGILKPLKKLNLKRQNISSVARAGDWEGVDSQGHYEEFFWVMTCSVT